MDLYARGEYVEAEEYFEHTEAKIQDAARGERVRYALYRASTLLALGDVERADYWLQSAELLSRGESSLLTEEEADMLRTARQTAALNTRRRERVQGALAEKAPTSAVLNQGALTQVNSRHIASP